MGAVLFPLERRGYLRAVFLGAVGLIFVVQLGLLGWRPLPERRTAWPRWPPCCSCFSAVSTCWRPPSPAPPAWRLRAVRGAALGVYNTLQSLGFFAGGAVGWSLTKTQGAAGLFLLCGGLDAGLAAGGLAHAGARAACTTVAGHGEACRAGQLNCSLFINSRGLAL